jgi:hypothetical protein
MGPDHYHNMENPRSPDHPWKMLMMLERFRLLKFDVEDI